VTALRSIYAVARADFLERIRRYSFFLTVLFAALLGYGAATGKVSIHLGDYRGVYTSAWIGTMVAMVTTCFGSLVGFYIVKNAIDRDRQTRVGQILAATPLSKTSYTLGKFLSNFAILTSMVLILALGALVMQFFAAEDAHRDFAALLLPFLLIALPTMALTAALAVLFETLPILRGGVGNVLWFFVFSFGIALPEISGRRWLDPMGLMTVGDSMMAAARASIPGYKNSFSLTLSGEHVQIAESLRWQGVHWTPQEILPRAASLGAALLIALLASLFFDRFDASRFMAPSIPKAKKFARMTTAAGAVASGAPAAAPHSTTSVHLTPLAPGSHTNTFGRLFIAELHLALKGFRWWWYLIAAGLLVAQIFSPLDVARGPLLATAWFWPVLVWSAMGTRESRFGTRGLLFSSPRILLRQLPACYLAGFTVAALTGSVVAVRLLIAGQPVGMIAWLAGALFLPSLALASGIVSGTGKVFEALLTVLWYIGPMNHTPGLDFTGAASGPLATHYSIIYAAISAALLGFAFFTRSRQLRSN
jgi:hypothetical protein